MQAGDAKVGIHELRTTQNVLAIQVPGTVEVAADAISVQTADVGLKRRALLFKMEVVPAFYEALFNADPLAALLDAWALSIQLEQYLDTGPGRELLTPLQGVAQEAAHKVRQHIESAVHAVAKTPEGFERAQSTVVEWAKANPITGPFSGRPSILPELAKLSAKSADISVFQAVGDITGTVDDLTNRLNIYAAYLPRAARWQAELLLDELPDRAEVQRVLATLQSVDKLTERTNQLISPEALQAALATATGEVKKERLAALASVDEQRKETLAYLTSEREAGVAALDAQRRAIMVDVDRQRAVLLEQLNVLRAESLKEVDEVSGRIIRKGALAMGCLLLLAAGLTWLLVRVAPGPRRPPAA
jgi:hypothetical protein